MTFLVLTGTSVNAQQGAGLNELRMLEKLIEIGDWRALYTFVDANPGLTAGDGALAIELRGFVDDVETGRLNRFDAPANNEQNIQISQNDRIY